jgi:hypothetical protein
MSFREFKIAEEMVPPREREVVREELRETLKIQAISGPRLELIWTLIDELEEGGWQGGFDEGYDHGCQDGSCPHVEMPT